MNKFVLLSIVGFLALSVTGAAQELLPWSEVTCSDPIYVDPGETIILNGTDVPPTTTPATTVEYAWQFVNTTGIEYDIVYNVNDTVIPQPWDGAFLNFSAPRLAGCYKAWLTVWFNRTAAGSDEDCISQDCFAICVNESTCPLCDNISCWEVAPTCPSTDCPAYLCFENMSDGLDVWFNVTLKKDGSPVENFSAPAAGQTDEGCVCIDWKEDSDFNNDTYVVTMNVYGPGANDLFSCTGNVSIVETPVADIRRES